MTENVLTIAMAYQASVCAYNDCLPYANEKQVVTRDQTGAPLFTITFVRHNNAGENSLEFWSINRRVKEEASITKQRLTRSWKTHHRKYNVLARHSVHYNTDALSSTLILKFYDHKRQRIGLDNQRLLAIPIASVNTKSKTRFAIIRVLFLFTRIIASVVPLSSLRNARIRSLTRESIHTDRFR